MKNIKYSILGVATLLFALTLNFKHALDDYGVLKNKLHVEVLAQSNNTTGGGSSGGGTSCPSGHRGPTQNTRVHCYGTQAKSVTIYENGKTSNGWDVRLNAQGNWQVFGASVGGQYNQGSSSGTGNTSNTVTISNFDFWATRYYCPNQSTSCCTPYDPCP